MLQVTVNDKITHEVVSENNEWSVNDIPVDCNVSMEANGLVSIIVNNKSYTAIVDKVDKENKEITVRINGHIYKTSIKEPIDQVLSHMGLDLKATQKAEPIKAPMPGLVLKILVTPGQKINKGDALLVLEAMKMENMIKATVSATVKAIRVAEKTAVEKGAIMIELE